MRILAFTDLRFSASRTPTGVGKHVVQMLHGLAGEAEVDLQVLAASDQLTHDGDIPETNALHGLRSVRLPYRFRGLQAGWWACGRPYLDAWCQGADLVYCPKNDYVPLRGTPLVSTIHGAHEFDRSLPGYDSWPRLRARLRYGPIYRRIARHAHLILTVSEFLKNQICEWLEVKPERIAVIGNGVEEVFFQAAELPPGASGRSPDRPFILAVGGLNDLDGADCLLGVCELLEREIPDLQVLVAGCQHETRYLARAQTLRNLELLGYVPAPQLAKLMHDSLALLYLTRYETFGMAGVEAMAAGTPVIASRFTAVPEILGNAALYVDADHPAAVIDCVRHLLLDDGFRTACVLSSRNHASRFTWNSCLQRLLGIFTGHLYRASVNKKGPW